MAWPTDRDRSNFLFSKGTMVASGMVKTYVATSTVATIQDPQHQMYCPLLTGIQDQAGDDAFPSEGWSRSAGV